MADSAQHKGWTSTMYLRAGRAALTVAVLVGLAAPPSAQAQTFTVLYSFAGSPDGASPQAGLVRGAAGNLYSTTAYGGSSGEGTVFKVDASGTESVLYSFTGGADGGQPFAGLVWGKAGTLYGNAYYGGDFNCDPYGCGTVFKVDTSGTEKVLHTFKGGTMDGCFPGGAPVMDNNGNLYGTAEGCNFGVVWKVSKDGIETVLYAFTGGSDGAFPSGGLIRDTAGNLYGTTFQGGTQGCLGNVGCGVVFKLDKKGKEKVLYRFTGYPLDGCYPYGTPALDSEGNLYGTAWSCGSSYQGIVWKVSKNGTETVLHNFTGYPSDGANPTAGVIIDAKGNLFGDTPMGGSSGDCGSSIGCGTVYKLSRNGTLTLLHSFAGADGSSPFGGLRRNAKGELLGTADQGGSGQECNHGCGTVWKLTP